MKTHVKLSWAVRKEQLSDWLQRQPHCTATGDVVRQLGSPEGPWPEMLPGAISSRLLRRAEEEGLIVVQRDGIKILSIALSRAAGNAAAPKRTKVYRKTNARRASLVAFLAQQEDCTLTHEGGRAVGLLVAPGGPWEGMSVPSASGLLKRFQAERVIKRDGRGREKRTYSITLSGNHQPRVRAAPRAAPPATLEEFKERVAEARKREAEEAPHFPSIRVAEGPDYDALAAHLLKQVVEALSQPPTPRGEEWGASAAAANQLLREADAELASLRARLEAQEQENSNLRVVNASLQAEIGRMERRGYQVKDLIDNGSREALDRLMREAPARV